MRVPAPGLPRRAFPADKKKGAAPIAAHCPRSDAWRVTQQALGEVTSARAGVPLGHGPHFERWQQLEPLLPG